STRASSVCPGGSATCAMRSADPDSAWPDQPSPVRRRARPPTTTTSVGPSEKREGSMTVTDHGRDLGVDLYQLHLMATRDLPELVEQYDIALLGLLNAPANPQLFSRPEVFGGEHGTLFVPWADLCGDIRECVSQSAAGLSDTATALLAAVQVFANADH